MITCMRKTQSCLEHEVEAGVRCSKGNLQDDRELMKEMNGGITTSSQSRWHATHNHPTKESGRAQYTKRPKQTASYPPTAPTLAASAAAYLAQSKPQSQPPRPHPHPPRLAKIHPQTRSPPQNPARQHRLRHPLLLPRRRTSRPNPPHHALPLHPNLRCGLNPLPLARLQRLLHPLSWPPDAGKRGARSVQRRD